MKTTAGNGITVDSFNRAAWLSLAILTLAVPAKALDGTFKVTERWSVTVTYRSVGPTHWSGVKRFGGRQTGTLVVSDGHYLLNNASGMDLADDRYDQFLDRWIYNDSQGYSISGGPAFVPVSERNGYLLVFLGAFVVKVPLLYSGELVEPAIWDPDREYTAHGRSLASISGGAKLIGGQWEVSASSTLSLQPSAGGGNGPEITISVEVDGGVQFLPTSMVSR